MFSRRFYREGMGEGRFAPIEIKDGESDLWIGLPPGADRDAVLPFAGEALSSLRARIAAYAAARPAFLTSLEPLEADAGAEGVVAAMLAASRKAGVGPMAAVAGAVAQAMAEALRREFGFGEIVVENGGDDYLILESPLIVSIYAGLTGFSGKLGVVVPPELSPLGLCTSSAKIGPSLSFGNADACLVACADGALADAYATAFGNAVRSESDIEPCLERGRCIDEILSLVIIRGSKAGVQGRLKLQYLQK